MIGGGLMGVLAMVAIVCALLVGVASGGGQGFVRGLWSGMLIGAAAALVADWLGLVPQVLA